MPVSPITKMERRAEVQARGRALAAAVSIMALADVKPDTVDHVRITAALCNAFIPSGTERPSESCGTTLVFIDLSGPLRLLLNGRQYVQFVDNFMNFGFLVGEVRLCGLGWLGASVSWCLFMLAIFCLVAGARGSGPFALPFGRDAITVGALYDSLTILTFSNLFASLLAFLGLHSFHGRRFLLRCIFDRRRLAGCPHATSLPMLERPVGLNAHLTRGGLPIPLSSAVSLPAYTNFLTADRIFKNDVDASSSGAVVRCEDFQGERSSFFTSNNKLSDILAILDDAEAEHVLLYLSTPSTKSRELGFQQSVRIGDATVPVRFQAFMSTNQSGVWASPAPVALHTDEVERLRSIWTSSYEGPYWFLVQIPEDNEVSPTEHSPMAVDSAGVVGSSSVGTGGASVVARAAALSVADGGRVLPTPSQPPRRLFEGVTTPVSRGLLLPPVQASQAAARDGPSPKALLEEQMMACCVPDRTRIEMAGHLFPARAASPSLTPAHFSAAPPAPEKRVNLVSGKDSSEDSIVRAGAAAAQTLSSPSPPVESGIGRTPVFANTTDDADAYGGVEGVLHTLDVKEGLESTDEEEGYRVAWGGARLSGGPELCL